MTRRLLVRPTTARRPRIKRYLVSGVAVVVVVVGWIYVIALQHWWLPPFGSHSDPPPHHATTLVLPAPPPEQWYFNNMTVEYHTAAAAGGSSQSPPPYGRVSCRQHYRHDAAATPSNTSRLSLLNDPQTTPWLTRSCVYTNLCFDVDTKEYLYFTKHADTTTPDPTTVVAMGGINPRWAWQQFRPTQKDSVTTMDTTTQWLQPLQWQPTRRVWNATRSYYQLTTSAPPASRLGLLFHSMAGHNVGHLLWDDFYPLYLSLRTWWGPLRGGGGAHSWWMMRHVWTPPASGTHLYASCDVRRNKRQQCAANLQRMAVGMGISSATVRTTQTARLHTPPRVGSTPRGGSADAPLDSLVCFPRTLVGLGLATDHGLYDHGWEDDTSVRTMNDHVPHNLGRGRLWFDFAQFFKHNLPLVASRTTRNRPQITFSLRSSRDWARRLDFVAQIEALHTVQRDTASASWNDFDVASYALSDVSLEDQVQIASDTTMFVTACGGGSMTATFLPRHASLVVVYDAHGGLDFVPKLVPRPDRPARLDADLLTHASHVRVHWVPVHSIVPSSAVASESGGSSATSTQLFLALIRHELAVARRIRNSQ